MTAAAPHARHTHGAVPAPRLLHEVFVATARRYPRHVAVEVPPGIDRPERRSWTYEELDRASDALASGLAEAVRGESVVAILLPRESLHLLAAQLAVAKAGGAWTCLDPEFPEEHVRFLLEDAKPVAVLTDARGRARPSVAALPPERVLDTEDLLQKAPRDLPPPPPPPWLSERSLAYVIYTSGTTGRPKGVLIEHGSIVNLVLSDVGKFGLGPDDRAALSSSASYDSSIEETWLAFGVGAAVVVMDDATTRLGPDLVPWLRAERITVFCPPPTLLRTTGCEDPRSELPELRLVYVGGEALPEDVASKWSAGRWLENGYGPTECTVTALRARIRAGQPITIGTPVEGNRAWVLDDKLEEVPDGEPGELCLGGAGVARGYLERPELTAEKFPVHPRLGRLYRTGDLVRRDADGEHHYLGRIDAQVKLRGHRVELQAIEAALASCAGVRAAACRVQGLGAAQTLAAFVVPEDAALPPRFSVLEAELRKRLPVHMVPNRFAAVGVLPTNRSGKLDRAALPEIAPPTRAADRPTVLPKDETERKIAAVCRSVLGLPADVSTDDDFFLDLGGTSLAAAGVVSALRKDPATASLTVRDVYEGRTVAGLAERVRGEAPPEPERTALLDRPRGRPGLAALAQGAWLVLLLLVGSSVLYIGWFGVVPALLRGLGLVPCVLLAPFLGFAGRLLWAPTSVALLALAKRLLIGRYRAGRFPVWGAYYVRHWIVEHLASFVPWGFLQDTVFLGSALRVLGAKVGRRVHVHRGVDLRQGGWDLLEIGDDVSVGQDASILVVDLEDGHLVLGPVVLRDGSTLEVRSGASAHTEVGAGATLSALSWLPRGASIPAGERWDGIPARPAGRTPPPPRVVDSSRSVSPAWHGVLTILTRFLRGALTYCVSFAPLALALIARFDFGTERVLGWWFDPSSSPGAVAAVMGLSVVASALASATSAVGVRLLGPVRPGVMSRWSLAYLRVLAKTDAVDHATTLLSGTVFWPVWLRGAGMKIGPKCEISTIIDVVPECTEIGAETFLADGIYLGGPEVRQGTVRVAATRLGRSTFLGNHVVVPAGAQLPDDVLVGVSTVADDRAIRSGTSWFGQPAFELPRREVVHVDPSLTFDPSLLRRVTRWFWETSRLFLPLVPIVVFVAWLHALAQARAATSAPPFHLVAVPVLTLAAAAVLCLVVLVMKWALLGRVRPGQHPLWSCWCSRWDFLYVAWGAYAHRALSNLDGTPFLAWYLRAMGCRIGKRVVLGSGFAHVVDPDMLHLEDDATVTCMFQAHSFEDRVLKIDRVRVGKGASVGGHAVLLYGADVGDRAWVSPHSVVMKHERLLPERSFAGCPTERYAHGAAGAPP